MRRLEAALLGIFVAAWTLAALASFGLIDLSDLIRLRLRPYFALAGGVGWLAGNIYRTRRRDYFLRSSHRALAALYLGGPPSILLLIFALAPRDLQTQIPVAPLLAMGVMAVFFAVPMVVGRFGPRA